MAVRTKKKRLRPYQREACTNVFRDWEQFTSSLIVLATGLGKTVIFTSVMDQWFEQMSLGRRAMILAHRKELIYQAAEHARSMHLDVGIEMAHHRARREQVVVSTVQSMNSPRKCPMCVGDGCNMCDWRGRSKRMTRFDPSEFGLIVVDESHHATANSYRNVMQYFSQNSALRILGVTATPQRADGVGLHNVFDVTSYEKDLKSGIEDGYLCPIRQLFIQVEKLDLSNVPVKGGDLDAGEVERAFIGDVDHEDMEMIHSLVYPTIQEADGRQVLFFAPGKRAAQLISAGFNAYDNCVSEYITEDTNPEDRKAIIARYKNKETQVLVNVAVLTEGFDAPETVIIANARPTQSVSAYLQILGRGTRTLPGLVDNPELQTAEDRRNAIANSDKPACIVLDFVGNSGQHKLVSVADCLAGSDVDPIDIKAALDVAVKEREPVDMEELIEKVKKGREERERRAAARRQRQATDVVATDGSYTRDDVSLWNGRKFDAFSDYTPKPGGATAKQVNLLTKMGVKPEVAMSYSKRQAGKVIDELKKKQQGAHFRMPFGKFSGRPLAEVPTPYLQWLIKEHNKSGKFGHVVEQIELMRKDSYHAKRV